MGSEMLSVTVMSFGRSAQTIARIGISNSRQIARDVGTREQTNVVGGYFDAAKFKGVLEKVKTEMATK